MHDEYRLIPHEENTDFTFHNARHKAHVHQHAVIALNVLVTEIHEGAQLIVVGLVVYCLGALQGGVKRERGARFHGLGKLLVREAHAPDALTGGTAVLLEHPLTIRQRGGESIMQLFYLVVRGGIVRHQRGVIELDQRIFGAVGHHVRRGGHAYQAGVCQLGEQFEVDLLATGDIAWVHARDISIKVFRNLGVDLFRLVWVEVDNLSFPALFLDRVDDRHGVLTVTICAFIGAALYLKYNDCLVH